MVAGNPQTHAMKHTSLSIALALSAAVAALAQDAPVATPAPEAKDSPAAVQPAPRGPRGPRGQRGDRPQRGPRGDRPQQFRNGPMGDNSMMADMEARMFLRMITRPNAAKELGLTEDVLAEINDTFLDIDVRINTLQDELAKAAAEQAELLKATPINEEAVMTAVGKVWDIRKQLAELQTKKLIVVLSTLTPEQTAKAREMLQNRGPAAWGNRGNRGPRNPANDAPTPPMPPPAPAPEAK